ncbi:MAG TPA: sterol desaturase family protein [Pseudolabrys sp.]|nr:sterol desaturase family protein [Pseudolabrys sp.]
MLNEFYAVLLAAGETVVHIVPVTIAFGIVFATLTHWSACNPGQSWWRKRQIATDVLYWFLVPLVARFLRIGLMIVGAAYFYGIHGTDALLDFYNDGFGPLADLPMWGEVIFFVVVSDFMLYWSHRLYHGVTLWKYHAVHHSSVDLDWISAARFHPINILFGTVLVDVFMMLIGISPNALLWVGPFSTITSAFVHANLNWTLGPFKYVIAGPVFHRWHHTAADRGGSSNFAGTFPLWDLMFGTWYMPTGELPDAYGIDDKDFPESFSGQMAYPYKR